MIDDDPIERYLFASRGQDTSRVIDSTSDRAFEDLCRHLLLIASDFTQPAPFPKTKIRVLESQGSQIETVFNPATGEYEILYDTSLRSTIAKIAALQYVDIDPILDHSCVDALLWELTTEAFLRQGRPRLGYSAAVVAGWKIRACYPLRDGIWQRRPSAQATVGLRMPATARLPSTVVRGSLAVCGKAQEAFFIAHELAHILYATSENQSLLNEEYLAILTVGRSHAEETRGNPEFGRRGSNLHKLKADMIAAWIKTFKRAFGTSPAPELIEETKRQYATSLASGAWDQDLERLLREQPRVLEECVCDFLAGLWVARLATYSDPDPVLGAEDFYMAGVIGLHNLRMLESIKAMAEEFPRPDNAIDRANMLRFRAQRAAGNYVFSHPDFPWAQSTLSTLPAPRFDDIDRERSSQFAASFTVHNELFWSRIGDYFFEFFPAVLSSDLATLKRDPQRRGEIDVPLTAVSDKVRAVLVLSHLLVEG